ncbi:MAG: hypothetical protein GY711_18085 [bacterium]|nr:hypothetical protein [bacterium]
MNLTTSLPASASAAAVVATGLLLGFAPPKGAGDAPNFDDLVHPKSDDARLANPESDAFRRYFVYDETYYSKADPTRVWVERPLRTGEQRPCLTALSSVVGFGQPSEPYAGELRVRANADAPVTFYAPDWGTFENGERSITVQADHRGEAEAQFTFWKLASSYRVIAHSPECQGRVVFDLEALDAAAALTEQGSRLLEVK